MTAFGTGLSPPVVIVQPGDIEIISEVVSFSVLGYKTSLARALFHLHNLGHIATNDATE
jgi:hypothetical protein